MKKSFLLLLISIMTVFLIAGCAEETTTAGDSNTPVYFSGGKPVACTSLDLNTSGNAASATKFASAQSITLTGDVTGTASSQAGWSITTTLSNSGVTSGTYGPTGNVNGTNGATISVPQITVDAKGRVTSIVNRTYTSVNTDTNTTYSEGIGISISGTTISNSGVRSIASGSANGTISVNTNGTVADVKVKGLGSAAYTNSSDYQSAVTGAATTITGSNLTANRALISNASGKVAVSSVSNTELGYLSGVTSAIQTQLNGTVKTTGNQTISGTKTFSEISLDTNGEILTANTELIAAYNALA